MTTVFITLVVVVATGLILLLNIGCTGMFTNDRPQGDQAMGLAVPIFGLPIAIIALTAAALLGTGRVSTSAMGTLTSAPMLSGLLVVVLTFGAALAAGMAFMLWCEPKAVFKALEPITAPLGILAGVCGPVVLAVMLLVGVWMSKSSAELALGPSQASGLALKAGLGTVCVLAMIGYGLGGSMAWKGLRMRAANQAAKLAEALKQNAEWEAQQAKSPKQRITEEFAGFSPDTPLWYVLVYLLDQSSIKPLDAECRGIVVRRALQVPGFDAQFERCMAKTYPIYRQAAAEFLIHVPEEELAARRDAWGRALLAGVLATGEEMRESAGWLGEAGTANPDPVGHVRSLLGAALRFESWSEYAGVREGFERMAGSAAGLSADDARERVVKVLASAGYRGGP